MQEKLISKKIVLSLAGVLAAAAFAPEASALPAFARQVGRACTACHAQHFPVLNAYGRDFKASGYTLMGSQKKIKDEHLSIPDTLNAAILLKIRYQKDNTAKNPAPLPGVGALPNNLGDGQLQFGDEFSLFFGGRVAENIGFLFEGNTVNNNGGLSGLMAGFKLPMMWKVGEVNLGVVPFTTDALGVQYGYELSSGGVLRANRWAENRRETSAVQYNADRGADAGAATGFAFVAHNDLGFINITKWSPNLAMGGNGGGFVSHDMKSTYVRIAATPSFGDWAMMVGAGSMSGTSTTGGVGGAIPVAGVLVDTKQTFFDFQAQGLVADKELGVYFQYANAPATVNGNSYNGALLAAPLPGALAASARRAWTIGADYSVIPHVLSIGAAYRNARTGQAINAADVAIGRGVQNNALTLTAVYDLMQNVALVANHSRYSGNNTITNAAGVVQQKHMTTLMLEGAW